MTNLDSILKSKDIILLKKIHIVKAMVFSVIMYGCEVWTIRTECQSKLWCWRRTLENPLDSKDIKLVNPKGNQP